MSNQSPQDSSDWGGCCLKGCIVLVVLAFVGTIVIYQASVYLARMAAAAALEAVVQKAAREMNFPEDEVNRLMKPVASFSLQIRAGKIGLDETANVGKAILGSSILPSLVVASFENNQIKNSTLSAAEKKDAHNTITRFLQGVLSDKIASGQVDIALEPIRETYQRHGKTENHMKKQPTKEELKESLKRMQKAADDNRIVETTLEIDLAEELGKAIQKGLAKK